MSDEVPSVSLHGETFSILFQRYADKRLCIRLVDEQGPYAKATVNVPEVSLGDRELLIKDWSENEGMLAALIAAGVVEDTGRIVLTVRKLDRTG